MGDRPPGSFPPAPIPPPNPPNPNPLNPPQRTFFSSTSAGEFFEQLQAVLEAQHVRTMNAQDAFVTQINAPIVALTAMVERLLGNIPLPQRSPTSSTGGDPPRPVSPYRTQSHPPPPVLPVPVPAHETTAFTFATAETAASALGGQVS